ncbi:MAG TPA: hypothetical protein VG013_02720 [Gemmataceae bacterium]|nr:hypothetical protein [Gemmataceae bacterium]
MHRLRRIWPDGAALAFLAAAAAWLFRLHLTGRALFIGNSDRLNTMLNILGFYAESLRRGKVTAWDETMFGGFNALALPYTFPTPLAWLEAVAGKEHLFFIAGIGSCLLLAAAGCAAYAFIRDVCGHPFAALVGAVLYQFSALTTLKVSQNDMSFAVLIVIPLMMLLLRRIRPGNSVRSFLGLAALFACLLTCMFLQKAAYALMLGGGYVLWRSLRLRAGIPRAELPQAGAEGAFHLSLVLRDWRPVAIGGAAFLVALAASFPRLLTVGEEMKLAQRSESPPQLSLAEYSQHVAAGQQIPWYVAVRWLDDGLFGRFPAESRQKGNRLNLNEGMLLYTSIFTVFLLIAGLLRFPGRWLALREDASYLFYFLLFGIAVIAFPPATYLVYRLFLRWDFFHARILVACILPLATLVALVVRDFLGKGPVGLPRGRTVLTGATVLTLAAVVVLAGDYLRRAGSRSWIDAAGVFGGNQLLLGPVLRVGLALLVVVAVCLIHAFAKRRPALRWAVGSLLGLLLILDAADSANFRLNGQQNRPQYHPYRGDNPLIADPGAFRLPSAAARAAFARRLETEHYRSVVLGNPSESLPFSACHLSQFWGLRLIDGYMSGVPRTLAVLPWTGECQPSAFTRFIAISPLRSIPWRVLALLNVKYAICVNQAFYTNQAPARAGASRETQPDDIEIRENPEPVVPRYFFAAGTEPVKTVEEAVGNLFADPNRLADVQRTSYVEGLEGPRQFATAGAVTVAGAGDRLEIAVEPSDQPRFLVLNENPHPCWHAYAGSAEIPVYRTNVVMRGLLIPPGVFHVTLEFTPFVLSRQALPFYGGAALLLLVGSWVFRRLDRGPC